MLWVVLPRTKSFYIMSTRCIAVLIAHPGGETNTRRRFGAHFIACWHDFRSALSYFSFADVDS